MFGWSIVATFAQSHPFSLVANTACVQDIVPKRGIRPAVRSHDDVAHSWPLAVTCLAIFSTARARAEQTSFRAVALRQEVPVGHGVALYYVSAKVGTMSRLVLERRDELCWVETSCVERSASVAWRVSKTKGSEHFAVG